MWDSVVGEMRLGCSVEKSSMLCLVYVRIWSLERVYCICAKQTNSIVSVGLLSPGTMVKRFSE